MTTITGGNGNDVINGTSGSDMISGGNGADTLNGGDGNDIINGGNGDDILNGGTGDDSINGGNGDEIFIHTVSENIDINNSTFDFYDGANGYDTLRLFVTQAQANALSGAISAFNASNKNNIFNFQTYVPYVDLRVVHIESIQLVIVPNQAPTASPDSNSVQEDTTLLASASVITNDTDPDADPLTVTQVNGSGANVGTNIVGTYGTLNLAASGAYTFTLNNGSAAVQSLAQGQIVDVVYTYQISDGWGGFATSNLTIHVNGLNDAPVANTASHDYDCTLTASVASFFSDVDAGTVLTYSLIGAPPTLSVNSSGNLVGSYVGLHLIDLAGTSATASDGMATSAPVALSGLFFDSSFYTGGLVPGATSGDDILAAGTSLKVLLAGLAGNDALTGGAGSDALCGDAGNDSLIGGAGFDILIGDNGDDILNGGADQDTAIYLTAASGVTVNLNTSTAQNTFGAGFDTLTTIEHLVGSRFDDTLTGNLTVQNYLQDGGGGNDFIDGTGLGLSAPKITAVLDGVGYTFASSGVYVNLMLVGPSASLNPTIDPDSIVFGSDDGIIMNGAGDDTLIGITRVFGSNFNDKIMGNNINNFFVGAGGNDIMKGFGGSDSFVGHNGNDIMDGGLSFDTYIVNNPFDILTNEPIPIVGDYFVDLMYFGTNSDPNFTLGADKGIGYKIGSPEFDTIISIVFIGTGTGNDTVLGTNGLDIIQPGAGDDYVDGRGGSNSIAYPTSVVLGVQAGVYVDLRQTGANPSLNPTVDPQGLLTGAGDDILINIQNIFFGSSSGDKLIGNSDDNYFNASVGDDTILATPLGGHDAFDGSVGIDTISYELLSTGVTSDLSQGYAGGGAALAALTGSMTYQVYDYTNDHYVTSFESMPLTFTTVAPTPTLDPALTQVASGSTSSFNLSVVTTAVIPLSVEAQNGGTTQNTYAMSFEGTLNIVTSQDYSFFVRSDDGAQLYIDVNNDGDFTDPGELVAGLDGQHGEFISIGTVNLTAGSHAIAVTYFQQWGGSILNFGLMQSDSLGNLLVNFENVVGGSGADTLIGSTAANTLTGGLGDDILTGGAGSDTFVFDMVNNGGNPGKVGSDADTVTDLVTTDILSFTGMFDANTDLAINEADLDFGTVFNTSSNVGGTAANDTIVTFAGGGTLTLYDVSITQAMGFAGYELANAGNQILVNGLAGL